MPPTTVSQSAPVEVPADDFDIFVELEKLLKTVDIDLGGPGVDSIEFTGRDPLVETGRIRYGAVAAIPAVAVAIVAAQIHHLRTGVTQKIQADLGMAIHNHDIVNKGYFMPSVSGHVHNHALLQDNPFLHDIYKTEDERLVVPVAVYPRHKSLWYSLLGVPPFPVEGIRVAFSRISSENLQTLARRDGLPFAIVQSPDEWIASDQGKIVSSRGPVPIRRLQNSPLKPFSTGSKRPLQGVKVIMCTHAIAGPSNGRVLAEYGADVLQIYRPGLGFEHEVIYIEANTGCRSTQLDLKTDKGRSVFFDLIAQADVYISSFAPEAMENNGITEEKLLESNPSLVICNVSLYGSEGPLSRLKGHDQNASASVGVLHALGQQALERGDDKQGDTCTWEPKWPEPSLINDFTTGSLGALGVMSALLHRVTKGGAWSVSPSLAGTATWYLHQLPLVPKIPFEQALKSRSEVYMKKPPKVVSGDTPKGYYVRTGHIVQMDQTPLAWPTPLITIQGSSKPMFLGHLTYAPE